MKRGEVWWVNFDASVGGEIRKKRPAVNFRDVDAVNFRDVDTYYAKLLTEKRIKL